MSAMTVVARTSLLRASRRPSTWGLGAMAFLPALLGASMGAAGEGALPVAGPVAIWVVSPLLAVALVAGTVGEGFERRTMVYWFTRPVSRAAVILGEFLANAALCAVILGLGGMALAVVHALTGDATVSGLLRLPAALALEGIALAGFSLGVGVLAPKHPVFVAIGVLVVLEGALPRLWAPLQYLSMTTHVAWLGGLGFEAAATGQATPPAALLSLLAVALFTTVPTLLAVRVAMDRDLG